MILPNQSKFTFPMISEPSRRKMSSERTLWLWSTLPKKPLVVEDQTWRQEGDAVENVHRLQMGETSYVLEIRKKGFEPLTSGFYAKLFNAYFVLTNFLR